MENQKAVLQEMMLKEFGLERFYKDSNPRGNLLLADYRRENAGEVIQKAQFAEELIDYVRNTNSSEREKAYFEKMLDL